MPKKGFDSGVLTDRESPFLSLKISQESKHYATTESPLYHIMKIEGEEHINVHKWGNLSILAKGSLSTLSTQKHFLNWEGVLILTISQNISYPEVIVSKGKKALGIIVILKYTHD